LAESASTATPRSHYREKIEAPWFAYYLKDKGRAGNPRGDHLSDGRE
jgi:hypothetical protein